MPATSSKVTFLARAVISLALLFPKAIAFPPPDCICLMKNIHTPMRRRVGNHVTSTVMYQGESSAGFAAILTPLSLRIGTRPDSFGM